MAARENHRLVRITTRAGVVVPDPPFDVPAGMVPVSVAPDPDTPAHGKSTGRDPSTPVASVRRAQALSSTASRYENVGRGDTVPTVATGLRDSVPVPGPKGPGGELAVSVESPQAGVHSPAPGLDPSSVEAGLSPAPGAVRSPVILQEGNGPVVEAKNHAMALSPGLGRPEWAEELGQRLVWMHTKSIQRAELRINPPRLGSVEVMIQLHDDQVSVQFASSQAVVREAIEAALPRLRELFNAQQLQLNHVEVAQQSPHDRPHSRTPPDDQYQEYPGSAHGMDSDEDAPEGERLQLRVGSRLLSLYA